MGNKYFYLSKNYAKKNGIWIYKESDFPIENYKEEFGDDAYEYIGKTIPNCPWYDEKTDSVTEMPRNIMIAKGIGKLNEGEYLDDNGNLIKVEIPELIINPIWDDEIHEWKEISIDKADNYEYDEIYDIKSKFFNYFNVYKKIKELNEYQIITVEKSELDKCEDFLKKFNSHIDFFDKQTALDIEENIPEIIKKYL